MNPVQAQIIGVTGYAGGELYRLLLAHPRVEIKSLAAKIEFSAPISEFFPNLCPSNSTVPDKMVVPVEESSPDGIDVVFLCTPHGVAMDLVGEYLRQSSKVIDLSGDYRLTPPHDDILLPAGYCNVSLRVKFCQISGPEEAARGKKQLILIL